MKIEDIIQKKDSKNKELMIQGLNIPPEEIIYAQEFNTIIEEVKKLKQYKTITAFNFKTNVPTYADLPLESNILNDGYGVIADGLVYVWNGSSFPSEGNGINLGLKPLGEVEQGNTLAVSGEEVYQSLNSSKITETFRYVKGYFSNEDGELVASAVNSTYTLEFEISEIDNLVATGYVGTTLVSSLVTYFDKSGQFLGSEYDSTGVNESKLNVELTPPLGTSIVRILGNESYPPASLSTSFKSNFLSSESIEDFDFERVKHPEMELRKYINNETGDFVESANIDTYTEIYEFQPEFDYYATGALGGALATSLATYFDKSGNFLGSEYDSTGTGFVYDKVKITPPEGTFKIKILGRKLLKSAGLFRVKKKNDRVFYTKNELDVLPQIKNNPLPNKSTSESIKILCFGSSWFMNTWWYLNKITADLGINADLTCFYSGGAKFQLWIDAYNNSSNINCWKSTNGANWTSSPENFKTTIESADWDLIVFQQGARQSRWWNDWENWSEIVSIVKRNTNPKTAIAFNSTWTPAFYNSVEMRPFKASLDGQKDWQEANYQHCQRFLKISGIDLVIPNGAVMWALRNSDLNNENDLATDGLHPDNGLPMYALTANLFQTLIAPIFDLDITDSSWLPDSETQKAVVSGSSFISMDSNDKTIIESIIKIANSDRFGFRTL